MTDEDELDRLKEVRASILKTVKLYDSRIAQLERRLEGPNRRSTAGNLYIQTNCLEPHIKSYLRSENSTVKQLADKALVSDATIKNILSNKTFWTREYIADAIFTAMGLTHILSSLTVVKVSRKQMNERPPSHYFEE